MTVRVEVAPDGEIEILRIYNGHVQRPLHFSNYESACIVVNFFIKQDRIKAVGEKFEPQCIKEARKAFKTLQERSPFNHGKKK